MGTAQSAKTNCPQGHPYDEENTGYWNGARYCKICRKNHKARYREAKPDEVTPEQRERHNIQAAVRRKIIRAEAINHYSNGTNRCACCGEPNIEFLALDHINNDGYEHRKTVASYRSKMAEWARANNYPPIFQVLCHNCNFSKHFHGECIHQQRPIQYQLLSETAKVPSRSYADDAGMDLFTSQEIMVWPGQRENVHTDVAIALPPGHWMEIRGRSSSLQKRGLLVSAGVIDQQYRGELFISVVNVGNNPQRIQVGDRIAQCILHRVVYWPMEEVDELPDSDRGTGGFGSTGR